MDALGRNLTDDIVASAPHRRLRWAGIIIALAFPTLGTWLYFDFAEDYSELTQKVTYAAFKSVQFAFPILWLLLVLREPIRTRRPTASGLLIGIAFGILVVAAGMAVFEFALRDHPIFSEAAGKIYEKIAKFGIDSSGKYFLLAGFYSLFHSFFEEYYWRWFVFRQLRHVMALWPAASISAIGFTLHHIIVLAVFFHGAPWLVALLAGSIVIGGIFWAWLFDRSDSVFDTWPSHLVIDAGIFLAIGYPLVRHLLDAGG
jgi:membrane protease YdiL (CAAX protease family)